MTNINPEHLAMTMLATGEALAKADQFDRYGIDLVFSNLAVITDRIGDEGFARLSRPVRDQLVSFAFMANDIAPAEVEEPRFDGETDEHYEFRTGIEYPIHSLQRRLHGAGILPDDDAVVESKIRFAAQHAGSVFGAVLMDTVETEPVVAETLNYFRSNANSAARAVIRITQDSEN